MCISTRTNIYIGVAHSELNSEGYLWLADAQIYRSDEPSDLMRTLKLVEALDLSQTQDTATGFLAIPERDILAISVPVIR